jgi:DNA-directed RNA polymerase subunit N (RpoN/RPB10)
MALSLCPKCENHRFEMVEVEPGNWRFKIMFVQCASCGTVVGTMDYFNLSTLIHELKEKVENVENKLEDIEYEIVLMKTNKK